ncbi:MAG TPA: ECF transporter S component [Candidatus Limnocylindrales bacterium]|nr:ECF transporter S component [Candidatus Limnocylindrales bacterium]
MSSFRWRTVDIVVASIIAVAFGVIFWAWGLLWVGPFATAFNFFAPAAALVNGVWFVPVVLAPLIIRKPGAALFTETVAALVSALLGSPWGWIVLWQAVLQGLGGEIAFGVFRYKRFGVPQALLAGALAGAAATAVDIIANPYGVGDYSTGWQIAYGACQILSGAVIAGLGSVALTKALSGTGVLDRFQAGRGRQLV